VLTWVSLVVVLLATDCVAEPSVLVPWAAVPDVAPTVV
jgi:hypothetical protein